MSQTKFGFLWFRRLCLDVRLFKLRKQKSGFSSSGCYVAAECGWPQWRMVQGIRCYMAAECRWPGWWMVLVFSFLTLKLAPDAFLASGCASGESKTGLSTLVCKTTVLKREKQTRQTKRTTDRGRKNILVKPKQNLSAFLESCAPRKCPSDTQKQFHSDDWET